MARKGRPLGEPTPPVLLVPRDEARSKILQRQDVGLKLLGTQVSSSTGLDEFRRNVRRYNDFNEEMLRRMFSTEEYSKAYAGMGHIGFYVLGGPPQSVQEKYSEDRTELTRKVDYLLTLAEKLDLIDAPDALPAPAGPPRRAPDKPSNSRVFVVHGRDEEAKAIVARFIERCGLDAVILHEQEDRGRTIIEKFEAHADVGYAVVILSPDDVGGLVPPQGTEPQLRERARQNVVLELGYFLGRLGRSRVTALKKGDLELPSDYSGVIYTPLGADDGWKVRLAKELRGAGYTVDMNKVL